MENLSIERPVVAEHLNLGWSKSCGAQIRQWLSIFHLHSDMIFFKPRSSWEMIKSCPVSFFGIRFCGDWVFHMSFQRLQTNPKPVGFQEPHICNVGPSPYSCLSPWKKHGGFYHCHVPKCISCGISMSNRNVPKNDPPSSSNQGFLNQLLFQNESRSFTSIFTKSVCRSDHDISKNQFQNLAGSIVQASFSK